MNKLHLLLLEEDVFRASQLKSVFESSGIGFRVSHISTQEQLSSAISVDDHDVILSGNFQHNDGVSTVVRTIDASGRKIPFVVITNPVSEEYAISLMKAGSFNYVLKERLEKLPGAVLNAIEKYNLSEKREQFLNDILPREAMMREAERIAQYGSWKHDVLSGNIWWSDEYYRILGYEPGEVKPSWHNMIARVHAEDAAMVTNVTDDTIKNQDKCTYAFRVHLPGDKIKYIQAELFVTRDADFQVTRINGFLRDRSAHVQAELRSVASEEKYYNLFENNPCALTLIDIDSKQILGVNKAAVRMFGFSREEFLSMTAYQFLAPSELLRYEQLVQAGVAIPGEGSTWEILRKDGSKIIAEVITTDINFGGRSCRIIQTTDITEKVHTIRQLQESEARLIDSQRIAHIGSWEVNYADDYADGEIIKWSDETYRIFGLDPAIDQIDENLFYKLIHPEDHILLREAMERAAVNDGVYSVEFRILLRDGSERIVSELGELTTDGAGRIVKVSGTAQDITERRNARILLQKSEANLRSIFENTDTAYVLLDSALKILSFNKPALKFSLEHLDKPIAEGEHAISYFSDITQAVVKKSLRDALHGATLSYEVNYPGETGISKWYYAHFYPVWDDDNILGVVMSLRDITQRKTSELQEKKITTELIQRNKDLEQFAYIISHNLRAPVANIMGITEALKDDLEEEERVVFTNGLFDSVKKLDTVIVDLNRILQLKNGLSENKEKVSFSNLVNEIKYTISGGAQEMFQLQTDFSEVDEMVTLKSYLHSIFYNLISNSIKYKRPELVPVIQITSRRLENGIELTFRDNGLGIDMEKNGKLLFGLYKRFHQDAAEGKGMGLFMVKTQVETLGGRIGVKSKVEQGAEFRIEFSY